MAHPLPRATVAATTDAVAYRATTRIVAVVLVAISRASVPFLLAMLLFWQYPPILPLMLMRAFTILVIAPGTAAWLLARACAVRVRVHDGELTLEQRGRTTDVPCDAIVAVEPWVIALPGSGLSLRLRSGRRFRHRLQLADPAALIEALAQAGAAAHVRNALAHPSVVYAHATHAAPRRWWDHPVVKFGLFALVPTLPLFRVHQLIAYGAPLGEYYLLGLRSYLQTFAIYYATLVIYVVLYAGFLRALAEAAALATAWVAPSRAARVRRAVEVGHRLLYYGGVPVFLIIRFLPW